MILTLLKTARMKKILWFPIFLFGFNSLLLAQTPNYFNITVQLKDGKNILRDNIVTSLQVTVSPGNKQEVFPSVTTNYDGYVDLKITTDGLDWTVPNKTIRIQGIPQGSSSNLIELAKDILLPVAAYAHNISNISGSKAALAIQNSTGQAIFGQSWSSAGDAILGEIRGADNERAAVAGHSYSSKGHALWGNNSATGTGGAIGTTNYAARFWGGPIEIGGDFKSSVGPFTFEGEAENIKLVGKSHSFMSFYLSNHGPTRKGVIGFGDPQSFNFYIQNEAGPTYYNATEHIFNGIIKANNGIEVNNAPLRVNALFNYDEIYNNKRYLWMGWTFSDGGGGKGESGKECKNCTDVNDAWDNIKWDKHDKHGTFDENISIISKGGIAATCFVAHSDKRIKKNRALQNSEMSKNIISQIEIVSYTLKDSINLGNRYKLGVIAQELEKIFPDAVSKITDFIPDIYQLAKIVKCDNEAKTLTLTVDSLNELKVGDKVRIISESQQYEVFVSAINGTTITVKDWTEKDTKKAFVYGKQVNDFRVVDYDRIFTLNVSATQALISKVETLEEQVAKLQKENDILRGGNTDMLKRLDTLESSIKSLLTVTKPTAPSNNLPSGSPKK